MGKDDVKRLVTWILGHTGPEGVVTPDATLQSASDILRETVALASDILGRMRFSELAEKMELRAADCPCRAWINAFLKGVPALMLQTPEMIDGNRFRYGTTALLRRWLDDFKHMLDIEHNYLIFNADETMLAVTKAQGKLIVARNKTSFCVKASGTEHITAMFCLNCAGLTVPPLFLFPNLKKLPKRLRNLRDTGTALFGSTSCGWTTRGMFLEWSDWFADWINRQRETWSDDIKGKKVILLLDNHNSRENVEAMLVLKQANIEVGTFPPHVTHILQVFDVAVARAFKAELTRIFLDMRKNRDPIRRGQTMSASATEELRCDMIESAMAAWQIASNSSIAAAGFRKCGIVPFSDEPLRSKYAIDSPVDMEIVERQEDSHRLWISSSVLTSEEMIMTLVDAKRFASPMCENDIVFHPARPLKNLSPPEIVILPDGRCLMFPWPFGSVQLQCKQCGQLLQRMKWPPDSNKRVIVKGAILSCPVCDTRRLYLGFRSWTEGE
jgi:hypothetical protein